MVAPARLPPTFPRMALKLVSLLGLVTFLGVAWALSLNRKNFPWRTVLAGLALIPAIMMAMLWNAKPKGRS